MSAKSSCSKRDNPFVWGGLGEKRSNRNTQWYNQDRVYDSRRVSPSIETAFQPWYLTMEEHMESKHIKPMKLSDFADKVAAEWFGYKIYEFKDREGRELKANDEIAAFCFLPEELDEEGHLYNLTVIVSDKRFELKKGEKTKALCYRIRKLTEGECYRLMGFEEKDAEACEAVGQSKANIYHQAGDSIVTTVLMGIFGELLEVPDYQAKIEAYADKLAGECR